MVLQRLLEANLDFDSVQSARSEVFQYFRYPTELDWGQGWVESRTRQLQEEEVELVVDVSVWKELFLDVGTVYLGVGVILLVVYYFVEALLAQLDCVSDDHRLYVQVDLRDYVLSLALNQLVLQRVVCYHSPILWLGLFLDGRIYVQARTCIDF